MPEDRCHACGRSHGVAAEPPVQLGDVLSEIGRQVREKTNQDKDQLAEKYVERAEKYVIKRLIAATKKTGYATILIENGLIEWLSPFTPWIPPELTGRVYNKVAEKLDLSFTDTLFHFRISAKPNSSPAWLEGRSVDDLLDIIRSKESPGYLAKIKGFFGRAASDPDFSQG